MKLIVDNREPRILIEMLQVRLSNIELKNLDIGDFQIVNNNNEPILIFERKSLSDLISSIKDGRYNEQSLRLQNCEIDNHNIYYIIEGKLDEFVIKNEETLRKMLFSSILSLSYNKGFSIITSKNTIETGEFLIRFLEKLEKSGEKSESDNKAYTSVIKSNKKSNITPENINEIMLLQIPGISAITANCLMSEFKTVKELIESLENNKNCLDNFKIKTKNSERKINKTVISNLKKFLLNESD